jgi:hypothetical protein
VCCDFSRPSLPAFDFCWHRNKEVLLCYRFWERWWLWALSKRLMDQLFGLSISLLAHKDNYLDLTVIFAWVHNLEDIILAAYFCGLRLLRKMTGNEKARDPRHPHWQILTSVWSTGIF